MIPGQLTSALESHPDNPFLLSSSGSWSFADTHRQALCLATHLDTLPAGRIACYMADSPYLVVLAIAAAARGRPLVLINRDLPAEQVAPKLASLQVQLLVSDSEDELGCPRLAADRLPELIGETSAADTGDTPADAELLILTSGTTGEPKCVQYRWSDLLAQVAERHCQQDERWLLAYRLNHFAGVQMLSYALVNGASLVIPDSTRVADAIRAMLEYGVSHVSSTPTFWRFALALLAQNREQLQLRHITLGSEAVSADLLQELAELFPDARIVHIYALTEAGSCISVSDGLPGLPASVLQRPATAPVQFRIEDDELLVKTPHGMSGYLDQPGRAPRDEAGWLATGDLVKLENDRILFQGRRSETINVGGVKVHPLEVEQLISALAGVKLARVYGQPNPVVGQIVAVDLVANEGWSEGALEDAVREACTVLPRHSRPRSINVVDELATNNLKIARRAQEAQ